MSHMPIVDINVPVNDWFDLLNNYANTAINNASVAASELSTILPTLFVPNVTFDSTVSNVGIGSPPLPVVPSISIPTKNLPAAPNISPIGSIVLPAVPTFTTQEPVVNMPSVPSALSVSAPIKNFTINTALPFPDAPDSTLPDVPSLVSLSLPTPEEIALPIFDLAFPTSNSLIIPGVTFSFTENLYSSDLLDKVKGELLTRLSGGTGLNPIIEQAIWNRGRDRESRASLLSERALLIDRSSQGFSRPTGAALAALEQVVQETQAKIIDLSRDIMIKQAELEQENIKTSIQQTIALEDVLIREHNNIIQRSFEVAKYVQDISVEIYKLTVGKYNSEVEAYKAFSSAYTSKVQAELAKIEIFKAQIEGEKLKGDINEQNIRIYLAQLDGVKSNVEIYKALVATVSEKLKAESLKIDIYKADIDAYSSIVKAKSDEYSMYSEQIKGELAKVQIFESGVKAFTSRIQAYAAESDVKVKEVEADISIQSLNIKKYEADIEAFIKQVQADQLIYESAVDLYKGESQMYLAQIEMNKATSELALKNSENVIAQNKYKADIGIQNAQITLAGLKASYDSALEAKKAAASIYAQIGASSLSAINVSASASVRMDNSRSVTEDITQ